MVLCRRKLSTSSFYRASWKHGECWFRKGFWLDNTEALLAIDGKKSHFYVTKDVDLLKCDWNRNEIAPLASIESRYPFLMVSVSLLRLDRCKCGFEYVLIVADHFKRFTQSYATRNKSAKTAARKLFNNFMLQFGFSIRNHHERSGEFRNHLFNYLHKLQWNLPIEDISNSGHALNSRQNV